jgi:transcriptional regulator with XRE-family HTH domain
MYRLRLKEVLRDKGISQGRLSRGANVPPNLISRMINDPTYQPAYTTLKKVADFLKVSVDDLIEEIPDD